MVRGLQWARKATRLARTEGAYVGQLWFLPTLHPLDHSLKSCLAVTRACQEKAWEKKLLVTASTAELMGKQPAGQNGERGGCSWQGTLI